MSTTLDSLPLTHTVSPASREELAAEVAGCFASATPIYPIGGGTSLDFGLPAKRPGIGLSLESLCRIVDYPAEDMTITVEVGLKWAELEQTLAGQRQRLPLDPPQAGQATVGGVLATNPCGPRRYAHGTVRDFVIGISAVDGRGTPFHGGGRVVKNVAGYDFCKLLTGSLGTLGVITQVTFKVKPVAERTAFLVTAVDSLDAAERLLAALVHSETTPTAIELLAGKCWRDEPLVADLIPAGKTPLLVAVGVEGTEPEVQWMRGQLAQEWFAQGFGDTKTILDDDAQRLWSRLIEFPTAGSAALVLRASMIPSGTTRFVGEALAVDPDAALLAHAGNGSVVVRMPAFPAAGLSRTLTGRLLPAAAAAHGNVTILSNPSGAEMTHQSAWGGINAPYGIMAAVKREFDPLDLLNPGRFVY